MSSTVDLLDQLMSDWSERRIPDKDFAREYASLADQIAVENDTQKRIKALEAELENCVSIFMHYVSLHVSKGTHEGLAKAKENEQHADRIKKLLAGVE